MRKLIKNYTQSALVKQHKMARDILVNDLKFLHFTQDFDILRKVAKNLLTIASTFYII